MRSFVFNTLREICPPFLPRRGWGRRGESQAGNLGAGRGPVAVVGPVAAGAAGWAGRHHFSSTAGDFNGLAYKKVSRGRPRGGSGGPGRREGAAASVAVGRAPERETGVTVIPKYGIPYRSDFDRRGSLARQVCLSAGRQGGVALLLFDSLSKMRSNVVSID